MSHQPKQHRRTIPYAQANYDRLCRKHRAVPTIADVKAIRRAVGPVSTQNAVTACFDAALLFFLPRSAVRFEEGSLLIGWVYEDNGQTKREVWFKPPVSGERSLCYVPGGVSALMYSPTDNTCDEWHPVISDIVDPNRTRYRNVQYAYFKACIKLLQATIPPPSIEHWRSALNDSTSTNPTTLNSNVTHQEPSVAPRAVPAPDLCQSTPIVDLTGSDDQINIKSEAPSASPPVSHIQAPSTQVEEKIQSFRNNLDQKEVKEIQQMLEQPLPSWIRELAEDVLQKKMLRELELAESFL